MFPLFEHESVYMVYNINRWPQIYSCKVLRFALVIRWIEPRTVRYLRICSWPIPNASLLPLKWPQFQDALLRAPSQRALCILIPFIFNQDQNIPLNHFQAAFGIIISFIYLFKTYSGVGVDTKFLIVKLVIFQQKKKKKKQLHISPKMILFLTFMHFLRYHI